MLEEMRPGLLDEWIAYYMVEPFGDDWEQAGTVAAAAANAMRGKEDEMVGPEDFIPKLDKPTEMDGLGQAELAMQRMCGF